MSPFYETKFLRMIAEPCSTVSRVSDSRARGPGLDTQSSHIHLLSFLLRLIQEGQFSVTGESMCRNN